MGVAVPEEFRADLALAGDWHTTSETRVEQPKQGLEGPTKSIGVRKRKLEGEDEEDEPAPEERVVNKSWGSRLKQYPGTQDDGDLDALFASTKDIKKTKTFTPKAEAVEEETAPEPIISATKKEDTAPKVEDQETGESTVIKTEESASHQAPVAETTTEEKPQTEDAAPSVVFKKRKPKTMRK